MLQLIETGKKRSIYLSLFYIILQCHVTQFSVVVTLYNYYCRFDFYSIFIIKLLPNTDRLQQDEDYVRGCITSTYYCLPSTSCRLCQRLYYFYLILTTFNKSKIMSEVVHDWLIDWFLVLNATFSNISAISWRPVVHDNWRWRWR